MGILRREHDQRHPGVGQVSKHQSGDQRGDDAGYWQFRGINGDDENDVHDDDYRYRHDHHHDYHGEDDDQQCDKRVVERIVEPDGRRRNALSQQQCENAVLLGRGDLHRNQPGARCPLQHRRRDIHASAGSGQEDPRSRGAASQRVPAAAGWLLAVPRLLRDERLLHQQGPRRILMDNAAVLYARYGVLAERDLCRHDSIHHAVSLARGIRPVDQPRREQAILAVQRVRLGWCADSGYCRPHPGILPRHLRELPAQAELPSLSRRSESHREYILLWSAAAHALLE